MLRIFAVSCAAAIAAGASVAPSRASPDESWTKIYDRPAGYAAAIEMLDDDFGLAVIAKGIQRTTDGARTWHEAYRGEDANGPIAIASREDAWVVAAAGVLLHTEDGGVTWQRQSTGIPGGFPSMAAISSQEAWITGYDAVRQGGDRHGDSALAHTVDGGETWQTVDVPGYGIFLGVWFVRADGWLLASQCHPDDSYDIPGVRFPNPPCRDRFTLLRSNDGGQSWQLSKRAVPFENPFGRQTIQRIDRLHGVATDGTDVYATSDAGRTWSLRAHRIFEGSIIELRFADETDGWAIGTDCIPAPGAACPVPRALARTSNGGRTWQRVTLHPDAATPFALTPTHIVTTHARYDLASASWESVFTDAGPDIERITFVTRDDGYATTPDRELWRTSDGGATWSRQMDDLQWYMLETGALLGNGPAGTYVSSDGGRSTRRVPPIPGVPAGHARIIAHTGQAIWSESGDGLWRSDDLGATWRHIDVAFNGNYHFTDATHVWTDACPLGHCESAIRLSQDGGNTWEWWPLPAGAGALTFANARDGWGSLWNRERDCYCKIVTHDGGRTWETISTAPWSLSVVLPVDADRAWGIAASLTAPAVIVSTSDGGAGATWHEEDTLDVGGETALVARDDRLWLHVSRYRWTAGSDLPTRVPLRTIIYRREIAQPP
jgi:photosystem II stability/assembly factor-like uncharacterized protein